MGSLDDKLAKINESLKAAGYTGLDVDVYVLDPCIAYPLESQGHTRTQPLTGHVA